MESETEKRNFSSLKHVLFLCFKILKLDKIKENLESNDEMKLKENKWNNTNKMKKQMYPLKPNNYKWSVFTLLW